MKNIPSALRNITDRILDKEDYMQIAVETNYSFAYIKEIKNQARYNEEVEKKLLNACVKKVETLSAEINLIKKFYENTVE